MSTRANIGRVMSEMRNGYPALSTDVTPTLIVQGKIMSGYTLLTAIGGLSALCESKGVLWGMMADVKSVHSDAVSSTWWVNTGAIGSAPSFEAISSV